MTPQTAHAAPCDPTLAAITEARPIWRTFDSPFRAPMLVAFNRHESKHWQAVAREETHRSMSSEGPLRTPQERRTQPLR